MTVRPSSVYTPVDTHTPCQVGLVVSVSASHTVGRGFASRPSHTKDHHKNGTDCLLAYITVHILILFSLENKDADIIQNVSFDLLHEMR